MGLRLLKMDLAQVGAKEPPQIESDVSKSGFRVWFL